MGDKESDSSSEIVMKFVAKLPFLIAVLFIAGQLKYFITSVITRDTTNGQKSVVAIAEKLKTTSCRR